MTETIHKTKSFFKRVGSVIGGWKPLGFRGLTVYEVYHFITRHFGMPGITEKAAAISYNFIMSIPPASLFIFTLIPELPFVSRRVLKHQLHNLIVDIIPSQTYNQGLIDFVDRFIDSSKIGLISSVFVLSLFFASNGVMGLMRSFNKTDYAGFKKNKGIRQRWEAIRLTLMLFALLFVTLTLLFLQSNILSWMGVHSIILQKVILAGRWVLIISLIFFSFSFIYRYAPSTTKRWHFISPGAVIATVLSILVTVGFTFFVSNFNSYNILYGSIGTIMVVMIMIFLNSLVTFLGFLINLSIHILCIKSEKKQ